MLRCCANTLTFHAAQSLPIMASALSQLSLSVGFNASQLFYPKSTNPKPRPLVNSTRRTQFTTKIQIRVRASAQQEVATDGFEETQKRFLKLVEEIPGVRQIAARRLQELTEELANGIEEASTNTASDPFEKIKNRFLTFKQQHFLKKSDHFAKLATGQSPKFMVISCSDSRVCPSNILGFQPGEAFVVRTIANLIPPWKEEGFPATSAALEFAVGSLKVEHILVIGHSRCGGIKALMSMSDDGTISSEFIESWITIGKPARLRTKSFAANQPFDDQCRHCEKESVNQSLSNLLTFPWIKELVAQEKLFLHGGYYDFVEGSFEQWTPSYKAGKIESSDQAITNHSSWC